MKGKNKELDIIVRKADEAGLSYGKYVAQEREKLIKRKIIPKEYISHNERQRLGILKPIYSGKSTLDYGAVIDFPRYLKANRSKPKKKRRRKSK